LCYSERRTKEEKEEMVQSNKTYRKKKRRIVPLSPSEPRNNSRIEIPKFFHSTRTQKGGCYGRRGKLLNEEKEKFQVDTQQINYEENISSCLFLETLDANSRAERQKMYVYICI
jgi:hypothetical protein